MNRAEPADHTYGRVVKGRKIHAAVIVNGGNWKTLPMATLYDVLSTDEDARDPYIVAELVGIGAALETYRECPAWWWPMITYRILNGYRR